jgi:hypothetical protein
VIVNVKPNGEDDKDCEVVDDGKEFCVNGGSVV